MRTIALMMLLILCLPLPVHGKGSSGAEAEVLRDFEQILDLWRDGRYGELYERTVTGGKESREQFARKLSSAPRRPACCWEKMQEVRVTLKGESSAVVRARLGFEGGVPGTEFVTKAIKLKKEGEVWLISQSELFSLANLAKKRTRYRYLPSTSH